MPKTWTKRQQAAHRKAWVKALRSGEYEQVTGRLHRDGGFCCLGVACDISGLGKWDRQTENGRKDQYVIGNGRGRRRTWAAMTLPEQVRDWLGLSDACGNFYDTAGGTDLTVQNDRYSKTFAEIANIIEREPNGLIAE